MSMFQPTGGDWIAGTMHYVIPMDKYDPTLMGLDIWFGDRVSYSAKLTWMQVLARKIALALTK